MNYFNKLPGFHRSAPGLEWRVLRRIHLIALAGTLLPLLFVGGVYLFMQLSPADFKLLFILVLSLIVLHWSFVMVLGIACFIVLLMKGPAYVADPYPLPDAADPDDPI